MHGVILTRGIGRRHAIWESLKGARLRPDSCRDSVHQARRHERRFSTERAGASGRAFASERLRAFVRRVAAHLAITTAVAISLGALVFLLPSQFDAVKGFGARGMDRLRHHVRLQLVHDRKWRFSIDDGRTRRGLDRWGTPVTPKAGVAGGESPHAEARRHRPRRHRARRAHGHRVQVEQLTAGTRRD